MAWGSRIRVGEQRWVVITHRRLLCLFRMGGRRAVRPAPDGEHDEMGAKLLE